MEESDSLETPKSSQFPDANSVIMDSQTNQDQVVAASEPETETPQADEDTGVQEKLPGVDLPEDAGTRTLPELPPNTTGKPEDKEDPLQSLEAVLAALESTSFGPEKLREAEDMVFDAYYRIREKRRSMFGSR